MYDLRQIALVFPRRAATRSITRTMFRLASAFDVNVGCSASAWAASIVPAHVLKSFAVKSHPLIWRTYAFTSAESITSRRPLPSTYWKSS